MFEALLRQLNMEHCLDYVNTTAIRRDIILLALIAIITSILIAWNIEQNKDIKELQIKIEKMEKSNG